MQYVLARLLRDDEAMSFEGKAAVLLSSSAKVGTVTNTARRRLHAESGPAAWIDLLN